MQDPIARAYSAWHMTKRTQCPEGTEQCSMLTFADAVTMELKSSIARGCLFNAPVRSLWPSPVLLIYCASYNIAEAALWA
jgi:hypothetical protein